MRYTYDNRTSSTRSSSLSVVPPRDHSVKRSHVEKPASKEIQHVDAKPSTLQRQFSKLTPVYEAAARRQSIKPVRSLRNNLEFTQHTGHPKRHHAVSRTITQPDLHSLEFVEAHLDTMDLDMTQGAVHAYGTTVQPQTDVLRRYFGLKDLDNQRTSEPTVPTTKKRLKYVGRILAVALLTSVVGLWTYLLHDTDFITKQASATTQQTNSESAPGLIAGTAAAHNVAYNPKTLTITTLGIQAMVESVGVTPTGALDVPINIWNAGWYTDSAQPGQPGVVVMDGHTSSTRGALFGNLDALKIGDRIEIERNDGKIITYSVVKTIIADRNEIDMVAMLRPYDAEKNGLNIISCIGNWIESEKTLENRVLVYAVQI